MEFVEVARVDDLQDGQMVGIDVRGQRVVLAKVQGQFYAIGAVCTHERTNLDEGALIEYLVYCRRHFSAFDIRTGEVVGPPAERPTPSYQVKVAGDKVLVATTPAPVAARARVREPQPAGGEPEKAIVSEGARAGDRREADVSERAEAVEAGRPWQVRIIQAIGSMGWLGALSDAITEVISPLRERHQGSVFLEVFHGGRWLGHALHPALSDLPIGLWTGSVLFYLLGQDNPAAVMSIAGLAGAAGAFVTGVADWTVSDGRDRRVGLFHGLLNTGGILLQAGSLTAHTLGHHVAATGWSAASLAVTGAAAYLGGHLVLGRGVMVDHTAWTSGPRQWTQVAQDSALAEGNTLAVAVDGRKVLLYRGRDGIAAIEEACSHAGGPLGFGQVQDGIVTCPWHGSRFRLTDGAVLRGPAGHPQPTLDARVREGWIEVRGRR